MTLTSLPTVDIVLPVHNEERDLERGVRTLHTVLSLERGFRARIVIAENGSSDRTAAIAERLTRELRGVMLLRVAQPGRGRALRAAWSQSSADVVAYMDIDLSTDLSALAPMIRRVSDGDADVAIGSRLLRGSSVRRSLRRELISRAYNALLRHRLHLPTRDAQCGFKALRREVAQQLLPSVADDGWFFDTELLYRATERGARIAEIPVVWVEDRDSTVKVLRTALGDLRGIRRLRWERTESGPRRRVLATQLLRFCAIGVVSTLAYVGIFEGLRDVLLAPLANAAALALTAVVNTAANRRFTFGVRGSYGLVRAQLGGIATFVLALLLSSGALLVLHAVDAAPSRAAEASVLVAAGVLTTALRFALLRAWVTGLHNRFAV
jgi:glycosyltransferase involved in cell wall biosynthesis